MDLVNKNKLVWILQNSSTNYQTKLSCYDVKQLSQVQLPVQRLLTMKIT